MYEHKKTTSVISENRSSIRRSLRRLGDVKLHQTTISATTDRGVWEGRVVNAVNEGTRPDHHHPEYLSVQVKGILKSKKFDKYSINL